MTYDSVVEDGVKGQTSIFSLLNNWAPYEETVTTFSFIYQVKQLENVIYYMGTYHLHIILSIPVVTSTQLNT